LKFFPLALLILTLVASGAINVFAVHFGSNDSRPLVRFSAVASGLLAILCFLVIPGAFLRFLVAGDSFAATQSLATAAFTFTAISLLLDIVIAFKLHGDTP